MPASAAILSALTGWRGGTHCAGWITLGARMRRTFSGIALVLVAGLAAACGNGASNTTTTTTSSSVTTTSTATAAVAATVPFVGCAQDGQQGPSPAPSGSPKNVLMSAAAAARLAYYSIGAPNGVLGPRGWSCFGLSGSNGATLYLSPGPIQASDVEATNWAAGAGPAIQVSWLVGDTSGRFQVAQVIARVFPSHQSFVQSVIGEGVEPASSFPQGPVASDKITTKSGVVVEYETPGAAQGLGTSITALTPSADPIDGAAVLTGTTPDLAFLAARLTADTRDLTPLIVQQFEADSAAAATTAAASVSPAPDQSAQPASYVAPSAPSAAGPSTPLAVVQNFYSALGGGYGGTAAMLVVPSKRVGNYSPAALSNFYGHMSQRLRLQSAGMTGPDTVLARYSFVAVGGRACNGAAVVRTTQVGGQTLIASIQALNGC
jgi:hypothetical protein